MKIALKNAAKSNKAVAKKETKSVKTPAVSKTVKPVKAEKAPVKKVTKKPVKQESKATPLSSALTRFRGEHLRTDPENHLVVTRGRRVAAALVKNVFDDVRTMSEETELKVLKGGIVKITAVVSFPTDETEKAVKAKLMKEASNCSTGEEEFEFDASEFEIDDGMAYAVIHAKVHNVSDVVRAAARG